MARRWPRRACIASSQFTLFRAQTPRCTLGTGTGGRDMARFDWRRPEWERKLARAAAASAAEADAPPPQGAETRRESSTPTPTRQHDGRRRSHGAGRRVSEYEAALKDLRRVQELVRDGREGAAALTAAQFRLAEVNAAAAARRRGGATR